MPRSKHDRLFLKTYRSYVGWRGVWLSAASALRALIASAIAVTFILSGRFIYHYAYGHSSVRETMNVAFPEILGFIFFNNFLISLIPIFFIVTYFISSRFEYFRFLAESEGLIISAEIADNTSSDPMDNDAPDSKRWLSRYSYSIPVLMIVAWILLFFQYFNYESEITISELYRTDQKEVYVVELSGEIADFSELEISGFLGASEKQVFYMHAPSIGLCRTSFIWMVVFVGNSEIESAMLKELDIKYQQWRRTIFDPEIEKLHANETDFDKDGNLVELQFRVRAQNYSYGIDHSNEGQIALSRSERFMGKSIHEIDRSVDGGICISLRIK